MEILDAFGDKVLGIPWNTAKDTIEMKPEINLSTKVRKLREGKAVTSQIYAIFDPLGLLSPITMKYKLMLQKLDVLKVEWDEELTEELSLEAKLILKEIVLAQTITFPRSVMMEEACLSDLLVIIFSDGGNPVSCAVKN